MNILIIPSAKIIEASLQEKFGKIPSIMIPLDGKMAIDYIYNQYEKYYDKVIISGYEEFEKIEKIINNKKYPKIKLYKLDKLKDIQYTVSFILKKLRTNNIKNLSINFGDTFIENFNDFYLDKNIYLYSETKEETRWTRFQEESKEIKIIQKDTQIINKIEKSFIGFFNFNNINLLNNIMLNDIKKDIKEEKFFESIKKFYENDIVELKMEKKWIDFGHLDNYYQAQKIVATRCFNTIKIDNKKGILVKTSTEKEKFINEIRWYLKLPNGLQWLVPRVFEYSLDYENPYISMEFYSYGTLHDLYLYGNLSITKWKEIFDILLNIQKELRKYSLKLEKEEIKESLKKLYIGKTNERLEKLRKDNKFFYYFKNSFKINGIIYPPLDEFIKKLEEYCIKFDILNIKEFNIIHGDYFFANILYEPNSNIIRLIDPRGDFGGHGIYGDPYYELAKLSHSIDGMYDFIVEDLFELKEKNKYDFDYKISFSKKHIEIKEEFYSRFSKKDIQKIKFIQSLLFLSMIPLHYDKPERQKVMLGTGIKLLYEVIEGDVKND